MKIGSEWHASIFFDVLKNRDVLRICRDVGNGRSEFLCPTGIIITHEANEEINPDALWQIPTESLQTLMDALWERGIRPKDRRHDEEAKLLREGLDYTRGLLDMVLPKALRKEA